MINCVFLRIFFSFYIHLTKKYAFSQFRLNYTLVESTLPESGLDALYPILDQTQADRTFQATFQKDCGVDDVCQSQLEVHAELELDKEGT